MCRRHVEQAEDQRFRRIPLLSEKEAVAAARGKVTQDSVRIVVDVLCANLAFCFRDEASWEERALRRRHDGRFQSCGSFACLTVSRCCLVALASPDSYKRKRYVLDEHSVDATP